MTFLISMFFPDLVRTRIFPVIEGPPGAGKTTLGDQIGRLLSGEKFGSIAMPTSADRLVEQMARSPFVSYDEWDVTTRAGKEVARRLKTLSTSPWDLRRELHITADVLGLRCDASIVISTNSIPISGEAMASVCCRSIPSRGSRTGRSARTSPWARRLSRISWPTATRSGPSWLADRRASIVRPPRWRF